MRQKLPLITGGVVVALLVLNYLQYTKDLSSLGSNTTPTNFLRNHESAVYHIVPHSHCDAAYKKTFDEYYETEVRNVLVSVLDALRQDSSRRFVWAETIFLVRWWQDHRTTDTQRGFFQYLVGKGQIEIVNGGWVMHDEGITRYDSQIHQATEGHDRLQQIFVDHLQNSNISVKTGWQIDPFGPSPFTVNFHAWAGMDFLVLNRLPRDIKDKLKANKTLQFYWQTPEASILVHVMDTHYASPEGFDWENLEKGDPIPITKKNVKERSDQFMKVLRERSDFYRTPHVMIPFGGDFTFQNATMQFQNMERIIGYVRNHPERYPETSFRYSTPCEFKQAVMDSLAARVTTLPVISDGTPFQPLVTGYYFQTPNLKQMLRSCEVILRACEVGLYRALRSDYSWDWLSGLLKRTKLARATVAFMQHHDAITATSYRFVIADYMQRLTSTWDEMAGVLLELHHGPEKPELRPTRPTEGTIIGGGPYLHETVLVRNVDDARSVQLDKVLNPQMAMGATSLVVVNSLAQEVSSMVSFVSTRPDVGVTKFRDDGSIESIVAQVTPFTQELVVSNLALYLVSFTVSLPPLGTQSFKVQVCDLTWSTNQNPPQGIPSIECAHVAKNLSSDDIAIEGLSSYALEIGFDARTFDLASITRRFSNGDTVKVPLQHDLVLYTAEYDNAYSFATNAQSSNPPPLFGHKPRKVISACKGPLFSQVLLEFTPWLLVRYRVLNATNSDLDSLLQVTMFAGPLPSLIDLASRFSLGWNKTNWVVEENGFLPVQVGYNSSKGVGDGNTRPFVSRTWIGDASNSDGNRFIVYTVDPHGVVSKTDGQLDILWQRRNAGNDWWKQGDDHSRMMSSVWLSLARRSAMDELASRQQSTSLANDMVLLKAPSLDTERHDVELPSILLSPQLHVVTLRLSSADCNNKSNAVWLDLQVENLGDTGTVETDLVSILGGSSRLFLNAMSLGSLTYLSSRDPEWEGELSPQLHNDEFDDCSLSVRQGGKAWVLTLQPRRICSVRIPVSPLENDRLQSMTSKEGKVAW